MSAAQCRRCGSWWSFTANPLLFAAICRFCPSCVAKVLPVMGGLL